MHLPQELVDYIVDFLHDDPRTLIQGSLVSRAWVGRTRSYLCETLKITRSKHVSSNSSHLPPLCGYVKALHFTWPGGTTEPPPLLDCFEQSELHTLVIHSCQLAALNEQTIRRSFAKFPCASITTLELHEISPTRKTLLILLSLFPNVDDLTISVSRWWEEISGSDLWEYEDDEDNDETAQQISSPRLRGSFKFFDPPGHGHWGFYRGKLLHTLAALPLQFQTVSLDVKEQSGNEISTFLNSCSETVRRVFVGQSHLGQVAHWSPISVFANLEELRISVWNADEPLSQHTHLLLRSVTSSCLQRVIIEVRKQEAGSVRWPSLDENLANLIKRHKGCRNLALQISTTADPEKIRALLPQAELAGVLEVGFIKRPDYWA